jgi:hypothetical protein
MGDNFPYSIVLYISPLNKFGYRNRKGSFKENQLDARFIFIIFRQTPLHVSGVSIGHHQEVHCVDTTVGIYCSF